MVQEFLKQLGMIKCLTVKNANDETVFDWSGDYEKSFNQALSLPQEDFVLSALYNSKIDAICIILWVKSDSREAAKMLGIFTDKTFINTADENHTVKVGYFDEQITINGCIGLGVL